MAGGVETLEGAQDMEENFLSELIRFFDSSCELISDIPYLPVVALD